MSFKTVEDYFRDFSTAELKNLRLGFQNIGWFQFAVFHREGVGFFHCIFPAVGINEQSFPVGANLDDAEGRAAEGEKGFAFRIGGDTFGFKKSDQFGDKDQRLFELSNIFRASRSD